MQALSNGGAGTNPAQTTAATVKVGDRVSFNVCPTRTQPHDTLRYGTVEYASEDTCGGVLIRPDTGHPRGATVGLPFGSYRIANLAPSTGDTKNV